MVFPGFMDDHQEVYRCFGGVFASCETLCRIIPPSVSGGGPLVARISGAKTFAVLRIDADGVYQSHVPTQLGFAAKAWGVVPVALDFMTASAQGLLHAQRKFCLHANAIGKPLVMKARGIDGRLRIHAETHPVDDAQQSHGNDGRAAGRTGNKAEFAIAEEN